MNYARMTLFATMAVVACYFVVGELSAAFSSEPVIKLSGILNVWASYSGVFIGAYLTLCFAKEQFKVAIRLGDFNRVIVIVALIIAPVLAIGTHSQALSNVSGYVECKAERKISSRYSSRTYAITTQHCQDNSID